MNYGGYTFVFFIKNINTIFSLKCDIYNYAFTKTEKSCAVDRLKMAYIKQRFIKSLPSRKYVIPLQRSCLKMLNKKKMYNVSRK